MKLVKFSETPYRGCEIKSLFVADEDDWADLVEACEGGLSVYLGEICGRHSAVEIIFEMNDFEVVTEDPDVIAVFEEEIGGCFGVDILGAIRDQLEEVG